MKISIVVAVSLSLVIVSSPAEARRYASRSSPTSEVETLKSEIAAFRDEIRLLRETMRPTSEFFEVPVPYVEQTIVVTSLGPTSTRIAESPERDRALRGVLTAGLPKQLKDVLLRVQATCGGEVISTCRPGARVRGSGRASLHASCRAADITVRDYACAYSVLAGTPCGYSTDPGRVGHVHVSCSPGTREYGRRFAHWQPNHRHHVRRHGRHHARA